MDHSQPSALSQIATVALLLLVIMSFLGHFFRSPGHIISTNFKTRNPTTDSTSYQSGFDGFILLNYQSRIVNAEASLNDSASRGMISIINCGYILGSF